MFKRKLFLMSAIILSITPVVSVVSCKKKDDMKVYGVINAYYVDDFKVVDRNGGVDIVGFNGQSEVFVPRTIGDKKINRIGNESFNGGAESVTSISIGYNVGFKRLWGGRATTTFDNLTEIELVDPLSWLDYSGGAHDGLIHINRYFPPSGSIYNGEATVKLSKGPNNNIPDKVIKKIYIDASRSTHFILPKDILSLPGVIIGTQVNSKQEGWEEGWNGNNRVVWGVGSNEFADSNYGTNSNTND